MELSQSSHGALVGALRVRVMQPQGRAGEGAFGRASETQNATIERLEQDMTVQGLHRGEVYTVRTFTPRKSLQSEFLHREQLQDPPLVGTRRRARV